ncbi:TPA: hypothetical protein ACGN81_005143 [Bacillus cereus]
MDLIIEVHNAAGLFGTGTTVVVGADVTIDFSGQMISGKTGQNGLYVFSTHLAATHFKVKVTYPKNRYVPEEVEIEDKQGSLVWNNPVCSVIGISATMIEVKIFLSRMNIAPLYPISDSDLLRINQFNPGKVFTDLNNCYRYIDNSGKPVYPVKDPLLPSHPTQGWGQINHDNNAVCIDPSQMGNFVLLEWGDVPRMLIAVWVPNYGKVPPNELDFVEFLSPSTDPWFFPYDQFPWRHNYPYMATRLQVNQQLQQQYISLCYRYLFSSYWLIYQLLAAKRQAVVVFPIQPHGNWGPFGHAAGQARLFAEIIHVIHRMGYTSGVYQNCNPSQRVSFKLDKPLLPKLGRVVLSGFSRSPETINNLLKSKPNEKTGSSLFGLKQPELDALFGADSKPFINAWKEIWIHDAISTARTQLDKNLPVWLDADNDRIVRCYQSIRTTGPDWIYKSPLAKYTSAPSGPVGAKERSGPRCSLVYFDKNYLINPNASIPTHNCNNQTMPIIPVFYQDTVEQGTDRDHHAVPRVTFGHAALLSRLKQF